ncbi:MAG: prephenate dehydratase [Dehalococcoidia bacterium]
MSRLRLSFLGPRGTFSEAAARRVGPDAELIPESSITAVTVAVTEERADEAVVPIENSLEGSVTETLDLLVHSLDLRIRQELVLPIEHCLIVPPGADLASITTVYSHPQALAQCRRYLERTLPKAQATATLSTAQAVERALAGSGAAAIAPRRAAEIHGAAILAAGVQDDDRNSTRFVVLAKADAAPSGDDKTSIAFNVDDRPGALVEIMQRFAAAGVNLTKIESRPARETLGVYVFLLDCNGHRLEPPLAALLGELAAGTNWLKILGSYRRFHED